MSDYDAVPAELRERPHWVAWKAERRNGKWTKVPYRVADGGRTRAACDDPRTWGTFEQAIAVSPATVQGIGYVFSVDDPFVGVDLDKCIDAKTGELHAAAGEILERLGGYQERSPSGKGMHAIVAGKLNGDRNRTGGTLWSGEFEVYDQGRFFTFTGNGGGAIVERQAELDALVVQMFGEPSRSGTRATGEPSSVDARAILDRHDDLAKIAARKGAKPKGGSASDWDFMLGCRAAEHGYDDNALDALIRHARQAHGEDKGERPDYVARTIAAVRRQVGYVGPDAETNNVLAELTKALRLSEIERHAVGTYVAGHGNTASATIVLDDGYTIEFPSFEHVAQPGKLADQLSTTVGIATDFSKLQSRRIAALVRRAASREQELREHAVYVDEAVRLLRLAQSFEFDVVDQASRWDVWARLDATDPEEAPDGPDAETDGQRRKRESKAAEVYARRVLIPVDRKTGVRLVHAGWFQHFMRLRLGASSTSQRARQAILRAGWRVRGQDGRIKATDPLSVHDPLILTLYLVPRDWEARQGPGEDR